MDWVQISIDEEIQDLLPDLRLGCIQAEVKASEKNLELIEDMHKLSEILESELEMEDISSHPIIQQTRQAYLKLGKKPGRYRPSAEALRRRVVNKKGLYQINNLVDLINLCSLRSGFSIGGYDIEAIRGELSLSRGTTDDHYEAIGRGILNIENLPVLRDTLGALGSPTSDSERTKVQLSTERLLMVYFDFSSDELLSEEMALAVENLHQYADAGEVKQWLSKAT